MKSKHPRTAVLHSGTVESKPRRETIHSLCREIGECVYVIRTNDGLIKIGHTTDLAMRKKSYRVDWTDLLAVFPGNHDVEQELHQRFAEHHARGLEYYHPASEIIDYVNSIRLRLGVPLI